MTLGEHITQRYGRKKDPISDMSAYSHGLPGKIAFVFEDGSKDMELNINNAKSLNSKAFGKDPATGKPPVFEPYACRTGTDDNKGDNLAQAIADNAQIDVLALKRRSNYSNTFELFDDGESLGGPKSGETPTEQPAGQFKFTPKTKQ
jgi:hypothetical protein